MTTLFYIAAFLAFAVGVVHSILGERYILVRLFRRNDLPKLFGGTAFTIRTLRFAWHITTVAWWGFAAILVLLARLSVSLHSLSLVLAATFLGLTNKALRRITRGCGRTALSMRYLSGGAVRTLTTFGRSSEFGQSSKTCQGPDSGRQG
jgi:hypothetical protein